MRIAAQLIQVATDSHLWAQTCDRELEDIFAVQDDIAQSVVKELRSALLGDKAGATVGAQAGAEVRATTRGRAEIAEAYAYRGETEAACKWLERAYAQRDAGLGLTKTDPLFKPLHADPRWQSFLSKIKLAD
ncbi:MAG TPA: hypothetical protein VL742_16170 [Casimicrobiaceae bacterium]|nr:hypothetical protein [Casimicrobiaceae bacterium]